MVSTSNATNFFVVMFRKVIRRKERAKYSYVILSAQIKLAVKFSFHTQIDRKSFQQEKSENKTFSHKNLVSPTFLYLVSFSTFRTSALTLFFQLLAENKLTSTHRSSSPLYNITRDSRLRSTIMTKKKCENQTTTN